MIPSERGRGRQMHAGALAARGDVLWFLHADTVMRCAGAAQIASAFEDPRVVAGNFRLHFDGPSRGARFLNALYPRLALLGLRYGDSGLFVHRTAYTRAGGFRPLPIFEDLDLLRRVRRLGRMVTLPGPLCTSSRRFESRAFAPVFARWVGMQVLYWTGCNPMRLGRWYYPPPSVTRRSQAPR
ncbi:MAG: glycosyltransferase [Opitutaceae bacterium]